MPVVSYKRRISTDPLPGVRKQAAETPISEGAGLAQAQGQRADAIAGLGNTIARVGSDQAGFLAQRAREGRDQADQIALLAAQKKIDDWELATLHDPNTGAFNQHGEAAFGLPEQIDASYNAVTDEIKQGLHTDTQRLAFEQLKEQRRRQILPNVAAHVSNEIAKFDADQVQATLTNAVSLAAYSADDPIRVSQELTRGEAAIAQAAARNGMSEDAKQAKLLAFRTEAHIGVINNLLANDEHQKASDYFEEVKDQIAGDKIDQMTRAVHEGSTRGDAQKASDAIIAAGGTLLEQREKAKQIKDPEVRDQALSYIDDDARIRKQESTTKAEDLMVTAGNLIDKAGIKAVPPGLWAQLTPSQKTGLETYARRNLKPGASEQTDLPTYYALMTQASTDPEVFASQNLLDYMHKIGKTEFKQLTELQNSIRKGDKPKAEAALDGFRTNQQILDDTLDLANMPRGASATTEQQKTVAQFRKTLDDKVATLQRLTGKKATNDDVQKLADDLLRPIVITKTPGQVLGFHPPFAPFSWFTYYRLNGEEVTKRTMDVTIADVPAADLKQIQDALRGRGYPVTDDSIVNLFIAGRRRMAQPAR